MISMQTSPAVDSPSKLSTIVVAVIGLAMVMLGESALAGWRIDVIEQVQIFSHALPTHPLTAAALVLSGIAFLGLALRWKVVVWAAGFAVALIGVLGIVQGVSGFDFGIETLLVSAATQHRLGQTGSGLPYPAGFFIVAGSILVASTFIARAPYLVLGVFILPGSAAIFLGALAQIAYLAGLNAEPGWNDVINVMLNTSLGFELMGAGLITYGVRLCRIARQPLPGWPAWGAGLAAAVMAVVIWQSVHERDHHHEEAELQIAVNELREAVIDRFVARIALLARVKTRWERERGLSDDAWLAVTMANMKADGGYSAFVHIDRDMIFRRIQARDPAEPAARLNTSAEAIRDALEDARNTGNIVLTEEVALTSRAPEILMIYPMGVGDGAEGFLGAALGLDDLLRDLVEQYKGRGFAVSFFLNSNLLPLMGADDIRSGDYEDLTFPFMGQTFGVATRVAVPPNGVPLGFAELILFGGIVVAGILVLTIGSASNARQDLARKEAQYRELFENAPVAMSWLDASTGIIRVNRAYEELLGYSSDDLSRGGFGMAMHSDERGLSKARIQKLWNGEVDRASREARYRHKDGRELWIQLTSSVTRDSHGGKLLLTHLQDITARKVAEEKLFQAQKMEALGNLAGGIAHDFNNMLLPIIALTEMSKSELEADHPIQENLTCVFDAATQAAHLVQQILTFSRQNETAFGPVDITSCISEAARLLRNVLPATITIRDEIDADVGSVIGDRAQLISVIMNLGSNAKHAMENKVGQLTVGLQRVAAEQDVAARIPRLSVKTAYARLSVSDTGCGMDSATLEKIFNPFFTTKDVGEGTGLGLSMVHGIVEKMGGAIDVASTLGLGTTFAIYLPLRENVAHGAETGPAERHAAA